MGKQVASQSMSKLLTMFDSAKQAEFILYYLKKYVKWRMIGEF